MNHEENKSSEVFMLNDYLMNLNSFFVFGLEWIFPLKELYSERPEDVKVILNESFRWLISNDDYNAILSFNTIGNGDSITIRKLIADRYCHFRDFESQQGYTRYLLELIRSSRWRIDITQTLFSSIEAQGFHQYFESDLLGLQMPNSTDADEEKYRADEIILNLVNQTFDALCSEIMNMSKNFTPKKYDKWINIPDDNTENESNAAISNLLKSDKFSLKQQIILLERLGFKDSPIWNSVGTQKKSKILSQLLGRNEQDIRAMLTYWDNVRAEERYNTSKEVDKNKVDSFLQTYLT